MIRSADTLVRMRPFRPNLFAVDRAPDIIVVEEDV